VGKGKAFVAEIQQYLAFGLFLFDGTNSAWISLWKPFFHYSQVSIKYFFPKKLLIQNREFPMDISPEKFGESVKCWEQNGFLNYFGFVFLFLS
jgi:hypothetical protein